MRTTLDIDEEVLVASKEIARRQGKTAGKVLSDLARQALTQPRSGVREPEACFGFRPFAPRDTVVTNDAIDKLREQEGI